MDKKSFLIGAVFGAGLMYLLDPDRGNRRRALVRDQVVRMRNEADRSATGIAIDARNRARGLIAEQAARIREGEVDDQVLVERVRSEMGRATSHARAIEVQAHDGLVTLRGPILREEVDRLISTISSVRGVKGVQSQLDIHDEPGDTPTQ